MPKPNQYASVTWDASDVQTLAPSLSVDEAEAFLCRFEKHIRDRLIEWGWDVIETLLVVDGIKVEKE